MNCRRTGYHKFARIQYWPHVQMSHRGFEGFTCPHCGSVWDSFGNEWK